MQSKMDAEEQGLDRKTSDGSSADLLSLELSQALTAGESWAAYLLRTERFFSRWGRALEHCGSALR